MKLEDLELTLVNIPQLKFVVLVGSRANEPATSDSDWDFAIQWSSSLSFLARLASTEKLRKDLSTILQVDMAKIDLIDVSTAHIAMRAVVAEEGVVVHGAETLSWCHFLQRTWRELEEIYWEEIYTA